MDYKSILKTVKTLCKYCSEINKLLRKMLQHWNWLLNWIIIKGKSYVKNIYKRIQMGPSSGKFIL